MPTVILSGYSIQHLFMQLNDDILIDITISELAGACKGPLVKNDRTKIQLSSYTKEDFMDESRNATISIIFCQSAFKTQLAVSHITANLRSELV